MSRVSTNLNFNIHHLWGNQAYPLPKVPLVNQSFLLVITIWLPAISKTRTGKEPFHVPLRFLIIILLFSFSFSFFVECQLLMVHSMNIFKGVEGWPGKSESFVQKGPSLFGNGWLISGSKGFSRCIKDFSFRLFPAQLLSHFFDY